MATKQGEVSTVDIRPGVMMLSVLKHLNYKPWFALAEFVDNSVQSFLSNEKKLKAIEGKDFKLKVSIELDTSAEPKLFIRDNAAGISTADYTRAFRAAAIPTDRKGLSEFGMGLKSAACWFAPRWSVRTKALGEDVERTVVFDIDKIVGNNLEALKIDVKPAKREAHYTEVTLVGLHQVPQKKTLGKIKEHLCDIFRGFTRAKQMELWFNTEQLSYKSPAVLVTPFYKTPTGPKLEWVKQIDFDLGQGLRVKGFAAIRETASLSHAGFALFRRGRLIQGSGDEGYRPEQIFGKSNSFRYQRIFGELHLDGFDVSHTKDGFRWDDNEQTFLDFLQSRLEDETLPILQQADGLRVRKKPVDLKVGAETAVHRTAAVVAEAVNNTLAHIAESDSNSRPNADIASELEPASVLAQEVVKEAHFRGEIWSVTIELSDDPSISDWLTVTDSTNSGLRKLGLRLSLAHPFMDRFGGTSADEIEPLLRVAVALGLSETICRDSGMKMAGRLRDNLNELLREALSHP